MHKVFERSMLFGLLVFGWLMTTVLNAEPQANDKNPIFVTQKDIQWKPLPGMPEGAEIAILQGDLKKPERYTFLLKLPNGYLIPSHWHSNDEETTVISGTLNVGIGDKVNKSEAKVLNPGSFALIPGHMHHYVYATGETIIQDAGMGPRDTIFVNPEELKALFNKNK